MPDESETVERYMPLARELATRYSLGAEATAAPPLDRLICLARNGLIGAMAELGPGAGRRFRSVAVSAIIGEMRRRRPAMAHSSGPAPVMPSPAMVFLAVRAGTTKTSSI